MTTVTTPAPAVPAQLDISSPRPSRMLYSLMAADSIGLSLAVGLSALVKAAFTGDLDIVAYLRLAAFLPVFLAAYGSAGLYTHLPLDPPQEARRCAVSSALMFFFLSIVTVSIRGASSFVQPTLFVAIGLAAVFVPLSRSAVRNQFGRRDWWGYPAVIFGKPESADKIARAMLDHPEHGLRPVAIAHDEPGFANASGIPVVNGTQLLRDPSAHHGAYAVLIADAGADTRAVLEAYQERFFRILVIPEHFPGMANMLVTPYTGSGFLGLEVQQHALIPHKQVLKRMVDVALVLLAAPLALPLIALIAIWVKLDSRGPAFFRQKRIGRAGTTFGAWKFRTMVTNAAGVLEEYLQRDPLLRLEWEQSQKLRHDPRVTRAGAFLRKTSLDELPQLWNVLKGEMSLVGPRPIVEAEVIRYGTRFGAYTRVPVGITGLWQISGRSDTTYEERVSLDAYYVRNWSVWLDLYILFRTVGTVMRRKGAY